MTAPQVHDCLFHIKCTCPTEWNHEWLDLKPKSYKLQLSMSAVHPPVNQGEKPVVTEVGVPDLIAGHTAVLMASHRHHALQVQLGHLPLFGVMPVETIMQTRQHLSPLVLKSLIFTAKHSQGQHDQQYQNEASCYGHCNNCSSEPELLGGTEFLNPGDQAFAAGVMISVPLIRDLTPWMRKNILKPSVIAHVIITTLQHGPEPRAILRSFCMADVNGN